MRRAGCALPPGGGPGRSGGVGRRGGRAPGCRRVFSGAGPPARRGLFLPRGASPGCSDWGCRITRSQLRKKLARGRAPCQPHERIAGRTPALPGVLMAQVIIRRSTIDLGGLPRAVRAEHARYLRNWRDALVTCGPIFRGPISSGGAPAGYLYQTDLPGNVPDAVARFMAEDPLAAHGVVEADEISDWHCALSTRQASAPPRPGLQGFFSHGTGKPGITEFRNTIVPAHRAHLQQKDASNCLARGYLTDAGGKTWLGSAMVYEFEARAALDDFFRDEPYCAAGLYRK